jgi:hypothetical protein
MQLVCPECGTQIPAENINIQKMVAVCPACNTVFPFDTPETVKAKRRKVKQPGAMTVQDTDDKLHIMFRTNFRLDRSETFITTTVGSVVATILAFIMGNEYLLGDAPLFLPVLFVIGAVIMYYSLGLVVYNHTDIEMDANSLTVSRKPLPGFMQPITINVDGIVAFHTEETPASIKEAYDTPRYRVIAEYADNSRRIILNDVVADYGYFIAQRLEERLHLDSAADVSRLEDGEVGDYEQDIDQTSEASSHNARHR